MKFINCKIDLSKKVFQPRTETEFWVKKAIKELTEVRTLSVLDIFAGSGCIGIAILKAFPESCRRVDFVDISKEAIEQIKINLKLNDIPKNKYRIYQSNLFKKLKNKSYDFIFTNPPYVAEARVKEVDKDVLKTDPRKSLFAGRDGMFWIEKFLREVKNYLKDGGILYLEFDPFQKEKIKRILQKEERFKFSFRKDQFKKFRWLKACLARFPKGAG